MFVATLEAPSASRVPRCWRKRNTRPGELRFPPFPVLATFSFSADVAHGQEVHCGIESLQHGTPTILQTLDGKGFSYGDCGRSHVEEKVKEKKEIEVRHRRRCNTVPTDLRHDHSLS